jgi:hypothetical protein
MSCSRRAAAQPVPSTTSRCLPVSSGRLSGVYTVLSVCTRRERNTLLCHAGTPAAAIQLLLLLHSALDSRHPCCLLKRPRAILSSEEPRCKRDMLHACRSPESRKQQQRHYSRRICVLATARRGSGSGTFSKGDERSNGHRAAGLHTSRA